MTIERRLRRISIFSRWELCLLALVSVPNIFVFFVMPLSKTSLTERVLAEGPPNSIELIFDYFGLVASLALLLVLLGYVFDFVRSYRAPRGIAPPASLLAELKTAIHADGQRPNSSDLVDRVLIVPRDLSLGAHVRGILRQRIVLSGGMVPALLNNEERALAILFHEYGHIKNWDMFLPGIIVYSLVNCILLILMFKTLGVVVAILIYGTTSYVCRRREHSADAYSVASLGSEEPLVNTLCSAATYGKRTFFHPSLFERAEEIDNHFPVTRPSFFWFCIWSLFLLVAAFGFRLFVAMQSGLFEKGGLGYFGNFAFNQFSYLAQIADIASDPLILIALTGIVVEISKYFAPAFSPIKHDQRKGASVSKINLRA